MTSILDTDWSIQTQKMIGLACCNHNEQCKGENSAQKYL